MNLLSVGHADQRTFPRMKQRFDELRRKNPYFLALTPAYQLLPVH